MNGTRKAGMTRHNKHTTREDTEKIQMLKYVPSTLGGEGIG
jgi:hypothetical protein